MWNQLSSLRTSALHHGWLSLSGIGASAKLDEFHLNSGGPRSEAPWPAGPVSYDQTYVCLEATRCDSTSPEGWADLKIEEIVWLSGALR